MRSTKVTADEQPRHAADVFTSRADADNVARLHAVGGAGLLAGGDRVIDALLALLLPGLAVLAGLIALQLPAYLAWKRVTWRRVIAAKTRHAPIEENFFRVRTISR